MKLLTPNEVSEILNCKSSTIYAWAKAGKLPAYKLNGLLRFNAQEISMWIESQRVNASRHPSRYLNKQGKKDIDSIVKRAVDTFAYSNYNPPEREPDLQGPERRKWYERSLSKE